MRYIYCHPLFDERKCAHRFSYQLFKAFERNNLHLERFDYDGTGEADGAFCNVTVDSLKIDLQKLAAGNRICLIGTRLGATIAFEFCCQKESCVNTLIMIEPVVNGCAYVDYLFRKQHLKDMMTGNESIFSHEDGFLNLEGYKTNNIFIEQIRQLDLFKTKNQIKADNAFVVQISASEKICPEYNLLAEHLRKNTIYTCVETFNLPVFWERIPDGNYTAACEKILEWCP